MRQSDYSAKVSRSGCARPAQLHRSAGASPGPSPCPLHDHQTPFALTKGKHAKCAPGLATLGEGNTYGVIGYLYYAQVTNGSEKAAECPVTSLLGRWEEGNSSLQSHRNSYTLSDGIREAYRAIQFLSPHNFLPLYSLSTSARL